MGPNGTPSHGYYSYLIRPDKSATRQLEELCLSLARIISDTDPAQHPVHELTPQRLAAFYRRLGGNYDTLFLKTSEDGLSFMYRTLGCFHSLQPTRSPFETPRIPCLTPAGFARWQTIQLLLSPHEHVPFLQKAVQIFDVPRKDGGHFPKHLPRECLPDRPDEAMEKWYRHVTGSLNQENYMRRLKYSPAQSPHLEPQDRRDSYTANGQTHPSQNGEEQARIAAYRRRSSVPDIASPLPADAERGSHWDPATRHQRKARSHSATRPANHTRQRSHTTSTPDRHGPRQPDSPSSRRHGSTPAQLSHAHSRPSSQQYSHHRQRQSTNRPKSPSTVDEDTGSEASSETSHNGSRRHSRQRKSDEERASRTNLWLPSFLRPSHKRRHSSDAGVRKIEAAKPPTPLRPEYYGPKRQHVAPPVVTQAPPVTAPAHGRPPQGGVRFRNGMFDDTTHSAPDTPAQLPPNGLPPPAIRYPNPQQQPQSPVYPTQQMDEMSMVGRTASRESSGGSGTDRRYHSEWDRNGQRKAGQPMRVTTVTGVSGRKYASASVPAAVV